MKFKRILIKLSGESLAGEKGYGIDSKILLSFASQVKEILEEKVEVALVIGGGNIFRGISGAVQGMDRATADYMGMLATVINSLALQDALEASGVYTRVLSAIQMHAIAEPYIRRRAVRHLEKKRVVIFAAGTGNPYFSTDTAASLRAMEIGADVVIKGTRVDGIYDKDPEKHKDAKLLKKVTYLEVLQKGLQVMDSTAISLCMDNNLPIIVTNIGDRANLLGVVKGKSVGSMVWKGSEK